MKAHDRVAFFAVAVITALCSLFPFALAFTVKQPVSPRSSSLHQSSSDSTVSSRRSFFSNIASASFTATLISPIQPSQASDDTTSLISDLNTSLEKVSTIPALLEQAEWDKVRTILKTPPVNSLWNLGESSNPLVKLAKATGEMDLMELKDDLAISLQMTDQYSYDNVFIYYQPGNGKVKVKEPLEMANKAIGQLKEAIDAAVH